MQSISDTASGQIGISIQYLKERRAANDDFQFRIKVIYFLDFLAPTIVFMDLVSLVSGKKS